MNKIKKAYLKLVGKRYQEFDSYWAQKVYVKMIKDRYTLFEKFSHNKKVIHFGCTDWPIFNPKNNLHIRLSKITNEIHGFDIDLDGIQNLKKYVNQKYFSNFDEIGIENYDVCLVPETIEHVDNVSEFLNNLSKVNANVFLITAPNCFSKEIISRNYYGKTEFIEMVHPDHNCWYSPFTLKNSIEKYSNLRVDEVFLIDRDTMVCCIASKKNG
ncbi:MAG: hypothetical protein RQ735_12230 [Flavobacteriaceae bacterium]|nr:hypothetical protein [Flavobacteriaceae bacterium]